MVLRPPSAPESASTGDRFGHSAYPTNLGTRLTNLGTRQSPSVTAAEALCPEGAVALTV
jgi:hypothetical protein